MSTHTRRDSSAKVEWSKEKPTKVYIRDKYFGYLPATLVQPIAGGDKTATVTLSLPSDWHDFTANSTHPSLQLDSVLEDDVPLRIVKLRDYPGTELPLQNVDGEGNLVGKSDMADLPFLHEAAILFNLKDRHIQGKPYTRVGDIVVAVNPFQWIDGLYSEKQQAFYAERLVWNAEEDNVDMSARINAVDGYYDRIKPDPHVYETSAQAYRGLAVDRKDQAILVSGESGAGKTATVKIVMTHLATIESTRPTEDVANPAEAQRPVLEQSNDHACVVNKVLQSNPVFEAFGNAKTVRNDNSSRFGKFTHLWFDVEEAGVASGAGRDVPTATLAGSSCETYLLEKARVVGHDMKLERTFHIFYQLLAAPEEFKKSLWDNLSGATPESFRYVGASGVNEIEGQSDEEGWEETKTALEVFGLKGNDLVGLMRAICIVLQLGNLEFESDKANEQITLISTKGELMKLSDLMGVEADMIQDAMTTRLMKTRGEQFQVQLSKDGARDSRDALAKEIYAQIFEVLVSTINNETLPQELKDGETKGDSFRSISMLDLFGFEVFDVNRFEQLCINYANERLQQKYVLDNFRAVQEEYETEGIELYDFSAIDNSDVLNLVEGRMGLMTVLNEECIRPKGNASSFVYKVKMIHKDSAPLVSDRLHRPWEFGVNHFAGSVKYDSSQFVERNNDQVPQDLLLCASSCSNDMIKFQFQNLIAEKLRLEKTAMRKSRGAASKTICSKFKRQLASLMANIEDSRTRYIRCIKPNNKKQPRITNHQATMKQLGSAGLATAITISRETFPNRLTFDAIVERFRCLLPKEVDAATSARDKACCVLAALLKGKEKVVGGFVITPYAVGKTKVFFRSGSLELLEADRMELYSQRAITIQNWARSLAAHRRYQSMRHSAIILQAQWRCKSGRNAYLRMLRAIFLIECWVRCVLACKALQKLREHKAATVVQSRWRSRKPRETLDRFRKAAALIRRMTKHRQNATTFSAAMAIVVEQARQDDKMKKLCWKIENTTSSDDKDALLQECSSMMRYMGGELFKERSKSSELQAELRQEKEATSLQKANKESTDAALAANKIQASMLTQTNSKLSRQNAELREGQLHLKALLKHMRDSHVKWKEEQKVATAAKDSSHKKELDEVKRELVKARFSFATEVSTLKEEHAVTTASLEAENAKLKADIEEAQETHKDDMTKMLEALETAHEVVRDEAAEECPLDEDSSNDILSAQELEILELRKKIEELTVSHDAEVTRLQRQLLGQSISGSSNGGSGRNTNFKSGKLSRIL